MLALVVLALAIVGASADVPTTGLPLNIPTTNVPKVTIPPTTMKIAPERLPYDDQYDQYPAYLQIDEPYPQLDRVYPEFDPRIPQIDPVPPGYSQFDPIYPGYPQIDPGFNPLYRLLHRPEPYYPEKAKSQ